MPITAPLRVPVELKCGERWFRLAEEVAEDGLLFLRPLPPELVEEAQRSLEIRFHLPQEDTPIHCHGKVIEVAASVGTVARGVRFLGLDSVGKEQIARYVEERTASR